MPPGPKILSIIIITEEGARTVHNPYYHIYPNSTGRDVKPVRTWEEHQINWKENENEQ